MKLKPALSCDEQIEGLTSFHKPIINDSDKAINILKTVRYYRISGYGIGLKKLTNKEYFIKGISLERLFNLYRFDSQLKNNLIKTIRQFLSFIKKIKEIKGGTK